MVHIYDGNLSDIVRLFCNVWVFRRAPAGFKIWNMRFIAVQLWSHNKIYECCYWMQLRMTNCLMAWCTDPTRLHSLSCNHNCDDLGHVGSVEELKGLLKPGLRLVPLLLWISMLRRVRPCWGMACFSLFLYSTSRHLAVIFISLHMCIQVLLLWRGLPGGRSSVCRRFVTLLFMQAGDYMQPINCPPHAMSVTTSVATLYMQVRGDDCPN